MVPADRVRAVLAEVRKLPYIALYVGDWLKDPVAGCTLAAQMLWMRMMFVMHDAPVYGHLVDAKGRPLEEPRLVRLCGARSVTEYRRALAELHAAGIPSETGDEDYARLITATINDEEIDLSPMRTDHTGVIYSRRMVKDQRLRVVRRLVGQMARFGTPNYGDLVHQTAHTRVRANALPRAEAEIDFDSESPTQFTKSTEGVQGEPSARPVPVPDFAAVERVSSLLDNSALRVKPSLQIVTAWLSEGFTEDLIRETLADCEPAYAGKGYQYFESILTTRRDNPDQRPGKRRAKGANANGNGSNGRRDVGSGPTEARLAESRARIDGWGERIVVDLRDEPKPD